MFITSLLLHCLSVSIYGVIQFVNLRIKGEEWNYKDFVIFCVMFFSITTSVSLGVMVIQYLLLISKNKTTNENIRATKYPGDVFNQGCKKNCSNFYKK